MFTPEVIGTTCVIEEPLMEQPVEVNGEDRFMVCYVASVSGGEVLAFAPHELMKLDPDADIRDEDEEETDDLVYILKDGSET
jgi:hypothetical protein